MKEDQNQASQSEHAKINSFLIKNQTRNTTRNGLKSNYLKAKISLTLSKIFNRVENSKFADQTSTNYGWPKSDYHAKMTWSQQLSENNRPSTIVRQRPSMDASTNGRLRGSYALTFKVNRFNLSRISLFIFQVDLFLLGL